MEKQYIHKFEEAGLGIAPFSVHLIVMGGWSSCDYCGTAIKEHCYIKDSNGKVFLVGNECVYKTGDAGLVDVVKREVNRLKTEARHKKQDTLIERGKAYRMNGVIKDSLYATPHPYKYRADKGDTHLDWVDDMFRFAGRKGKCEASALLIEKGHKLLSSEDISLIEDNVSVFANEWQAWRDYEESSKKLEEVLKEKERKNNQAKIAEENSDIILILQEMNQTPFVRDMTTLLNKQTLADFSGNQFNILTDIYAKTFGKRNSKEYNQAVESFVKRKQALDI